MPSLRWRTRHLQEAFGSAPVGTASCEARRIVAHLDREETLVIPVLLAMTTLEAWSLIHG
jgi:hypothetical protein